MIEFRALSVSELNNYIAQLFSLDEVLSDVRIKGEISNFKNHSSGHLYFSLKDDNSKISCVMFRGNASYLSFLPQEGMEVEIYGRVGVYEKSGAYQIYVDKMQKAGVGNLYERFLKLKESLNEKGYFDEKNKKDIPFMPKRIALVTSPTGAAIRDMISVLKRRFPIVEVIVCPVLVQGEEAKWDIAQMLNRINENDLADVILLARGGGSIEELWAFNEFVVAEAIFQSNIPIISGVGHETDFTIADFVSDLRAPTPSVAAELAVPDLYEIKEKLIKCQNAISESLSYKINRYKDKLDSLAKSPAISKPYSMIEQKLMRLDILSEKLKSSVDHKLELTTSKLALMQEILKSLSIDNVLNRGFVMLKRNDSPVVIEEINPKDEITIIGKNKLAECSVNNIKEL